jgi:hypothetical protein
MKPKIIEFPKDPRYHFTRERYRPAYGGEDNRFCYQFNCYLQEVKDSVTRETATENIGEIHVAYSVSRRRYRLSNIQGLAGVQGYDSDDIRALARMLEIAASYCRNQNNRLSRCKT